MTLTRTILLLAIVFAGNMLAGEVTPLLRATLPLPAPANAIAAKGSHAFVATDSAGILIIDLSNPSLPRQVGTIPTPNSASDIKISGHLAYIADLSGSLHIFDITNPLAAERIATYPTADTPRDLELVGTTIYLLVGSEIHVIDASEPADPRFVKAITEAPIAQIAANESYLCSIPTPEGDGLARVYDLSAPLNPTIFTAIAYPAAYQGLDRFTGVALARNSVYLTHLQYYQYGVGDIRPGANSGYLHDISTPNAPRLRYYSDAGPVWSINQFLISKLGRAFEFSAEAFAERVNMPVTGIVAAAPLTDSHLLFGVGSDLKIVLLAPPNPRPSVKFDFGRSVHDVVTRADQAFVGGDFGLKIFNISSPLAPQQIAEYVGPAVREILLRDNYAYIWANSTFRTLDFTDLANIRSTTNMTGRAFGQMHVLGNRIYGISAAATLVLACFDFSDPFQLAGPTNIASANKLFGAVGPFLITGRGETTINVYDASTVRYLFAGAWNRGTGIAIRDLKIQGNLGYCLEVNKLEILDLTNPIQPILVGSAPLPEPTAQIQPSVEMMIVDNFLYISTGQSLIVCDVRDPSAPRMVARNPSLPARRVAFDGQRIHVAAGYNGYSILERHPQIWLQPTPAGLRIDGPPGLSGEIQTSSDLQDWINLLPVTLTEEPQIIADDPSGDPKRFYRFFGSSPP